MTVEEVATDAQFAAVREIFERGDEWSPGEEWLRGPGFVTRYLARIDGAPVATADITWLDDDAAVFLGGALTLPEQRGRGAYRALVHARWRAAAHRAARCWSRSRSRCRSRSCSASASNVVGEIHVLVDRF